VNSPHLLVAGFPGLTTISASTVFAMTLANVERLPRGSMLLDYLRTIRSISEESVLTQRPANVEKNCVVKVARKDADISNAHGKGAMAEQQVNDSSQPK
jgi:hypothetical protein